MRQVYKSVFAHVLSVGDVTLGRQQSRELLVDGFIATPGDRSLGSFGEHAWGVGSGVPLLSQVVDERMSTYPIPPELAE